MIRMTSPAHLQKHAVEAKKECPPPPHLAHLKITHTANILFECSEYVVRFARFLMCGLSKCAAYA